MQPHPAGCSIAESDFHLFPASYPLGSSTDFNPDPSIIFQVFSKSFAISQQKTRESEDRCAGVRASIVVDQHFLNLIRLPKELDQSGDKKMAAFSGIASLMSYLPSTLAILPTNTLSIHCCGSMRDEGRSPEFGRK
jgi:hypothetical protein